MPERTCDGDWLDAIGEALNNADPETLVSVATATLSIIARDYCPTAEASSRCPGGRNPQACAECWVRYATEGE